jgi:hypothetical protein
MAYHKAKLKNSGDKSSPCFRPFWIGKVCLMKQKLFTVRIIVSIHIHAVGRMVSYSILKFVVCILLRVPGQGDLLQSVWLQLQYVNKSSNR